MVGKVTPVPTEKNLVPWSSVLTLFVGSVGVTKIDWPCQLPSVMDLPIHDTEWTARGGSSQSHKGNVIEQNWNSDSHRASGRVSKKAQVLKWAVGYLQI